MGLWDKLFGPPKPAKFAELFVAALRKAGDTREIEFDDPEFRLIFKKDNEVVGICNLQNMYDEYCSADSGDRAQHMRELVRGALSSLKEMPEDFADARYDLRPRLWARATFENMRLERQVGESGDLDLPMQPVGEHLVATLVYDFPEAVRSISVSDLEQWGVTVYEALEVARHNLEEAEFAFAQIGDHVYASMTGDTYDASRLLLMNLMERLEVRGRPVAMVPNRNTLLISGSEDETGLGIMHELASSAFEDDPRPMIATPLMLDDGQWVDWMPPADHPHFDAFRDLELKWLYQEYAHQKEVLDTIHESDGDDIFVASYSAVEKEGGELVSYCVWGNGCLTLLPKTHKVALMDDPDDAPRTISWERLVEQFGHLLQPTDFYPARYRVSQFPTPEQFAALEDEGM